MSQIQYFTYNVPAPTRERIPPLAILAGLFIVGSVAFAPLPGFNYAVKVAGAILGVGYVFHIFRRRTRIPGEVLAYLAWFLWGSLGAMIAVAPVLFWYKWTTVLQIWILLVILAGFTTNRRVLSFNFLMFLLAALLLGGYSVVTGEYRRAEQEGLRVAGLALNANAFGMTILMATACMAYFWMQPSKLLRGLKYGLLIAGMAFAAGSIVLSGSRKSLLAMILFYLAWMFFCYRKEALSRARVLLVIFLGLGLGSYGMYRVLQGSELSDRMSRTWEAMTTNHEVNDSGSERLTLYAQAGRIILENPVMGVGLDQYRIRSSTFHAAHSEYAEVTADTGLIGAAIYFLWYVIIWRRAGKIVKWSPNHIERHNAGLIRAVLLVLLALGVGSWFYDSKYMWVIMGSFIGYTNVVWDRIRTELSSAYYEVPAEHYLQTGEYMEAS